MASGGGDDGGGTGGGGGGSSNSSSSSTHVTVFSPRLGFDPLSIFAGTDTLTCDIIANYC